MKSNLLLPTILSALFVGALPASAQNAPIACECNVDDASNCGADQHCELWDSYCGFCADDGGEQGACECLGAGDCPDGYACELSSNSCGSCVAADSDFIACDCIVDADCSDPAMVCEPNEEVIGCGHCTMPANEPPECFEDSDCPPEMQCHVDDSGWGQCLPTLDPVPCQCFDDADCLDGFYCDATACACLEDGSDNDTCDQCYADSDCPDSYACVNEDGCNVCAFRDRAIPCECSSDGECAAGESCDYSLGDGATCGLCAADECECTGDLDCGAGAYCSNDTCGECIDKTANTGDGDGDGDDEELFINPEAPSCGCAGSAEPRGDLALFSLLAGFGLARRRRRGA